MGLFLRCGVCHDAIYIEHVQRLHNAVEHGRAVDGQEKMGAIVLSNVQNQY